MSDFLSELDFLNGSRYKPETLHVEPTSRGVGKKRDEELQDKKANTKNVQQSTDMDEGAEEKVSVEYTVSIMKDGSYREGEVKGAIFITKCSSVNGFRGAKKAAYLKIMKTDLRKKYHRYIERRLSGKKNKGKRYKISFMADGSILEGNIIDCIHFEEVISKVNFFAAVKIAKKKFAKLFPDFGQTRVRRKKIVMANDSVVTRDNSLLYFIPDEGELVPYGIEAANCMGSVFYVGGPCHKHPLNHVRYRSNRHCALCCSKLNIEN